MNLLLRENHLLSGLGRTFGPGSREPGPRPDTPALQGFQGAGISGALASAPGSTLRAQAFCLLPPGAAAGQRPGSQGLIPGLAVSWALPVPRARRLEAGRNLKHLAGRRRPVPAGPSAAL